HTHTHTHTHTDRPRVSATQPLSAEPRGGSLESNLLQASAIHHLHAHVDDNAGLLEKHEAQLHLLKNHVRAGRIGTRQATEVPLLSDRTPGVTRHLTF